MTLIRPWQPGHVWAMSETSASSAMSFKRSGSTPSGLCLGVSRVFLAVNAKGLIAV